MEALSPLKGVSGGKAESELPNDEFNMQTRPGRTFSTMCRGTEA